MNHYCSITLVIAVVMAASLFLYVSDNILITISLVPSSVLPDQSPGPTRNHTPSAVGLVWHPDPGKHGTAHPYHHNSGLV